MNIYIGNLSYDASEADLQTLFGEFGEVTSCKIISDKYTGRSKGFGFIEMSNDDEAKAAMAELNGKELQGRELKVNEARPRQESDRGSNY